MTFRPVFVTQPTLSNKKRPKMLILGRLNFNKSVFECSCETRMGFIGAENETRTRDPDLGKVVLYQLSYFRNKTDN